MVVSAGQGHAAPLFSLAGIERRWGEQIALSQLDLSISSGELVAIVGPSGGGKSTLLRLLVGQLRPSGGRLSIVGEDVTSMSQGALQRHRRRCAYVEQGGQIYPGLSVYRNVLAGRLASWPWWRVAASMLWPVLQDEVRDALKLVGLGDRMWDSATVLSGGQQQRVAIARALMTAPEVGMNTQALQGLIWLVDEPTAALDPTTAHEIVSLLLSHCREKGATLLWCTHWLSLIQSDVDRVLGIGGGRLVFDLPPAQVTDAELSALYEGSDERAR